MINIPRHEPSTMHMSVKWTPWCISTYNQTTTATTTTTTSTVPKSFKTHSPTWTTVTTTTQRMHIQSMTYISNNSTNDTPTFENRFNDIYNIYTNTPIIITLSSPEFKQPIIKHRNHFGYRATRLGEYIYSPWRAQRMGYSPQAS